MIRIHRADSISHTTFGIRCRFTTRKIRRFIFLTALLTASGCIGTDFLNETVELFDPRIVISPPVEAIEVNQTLLYEAVYYDSTDTPRSAPFTWTSSDNAIASISPDGSVTGLSPGQVRITAAAFGISSEMALLTVVQNADEVALIDVSPSDTNITVLNTLQYTATVMNARGEEVSDVAIEWRTSVDSVALITEQGLLRGLRPGTVKVTAHANGIESSPALLDVFARSRSGSFERTPGTSYQIQGTATLEQTDVGLRLHFLENFNVSNGPDLHVYLSTTSKVNATSLDLGNLQSPAGAQTYAVPGNVRMNDFDYVIIHCLPFNVTFGFARIN